MKRIGVSRGMAVTVACVGVMLGVPAGVSAASLGLAAGGRHQHSDATGGRKLWLARYHGLGYGQPRAMVVSPNGSTVLVTGFTRSGPVVEATTVAFRAATGDRLWAARYRSGGPGYSDDAAAIAVSPDGAAVYVTGEGSSKNGPGYYTTLAYKTTTGAQLWERNYSPSSNSAATSVAVSPDGKTVFVTGSTSYGGAYATIAYNAATGAQRWLASYNGVGGGVTGATSVAASPGGSAVYVTGTVGTSSGAVDFGTVAYDAATGAQLWATIYASPAGENSAGSLAVSPDGSEVFVQGLSENTGNTGQDYATVAYSAATGSQVWARRYSNGEGNPSSLVVSPDGSDLFVTGTETIKGVEYYTTRAFSTATGSQVWLRRYLAHPGNAISMAVSPDGSKVFVTGDITVNGAPQPDFGTVAYSAATGAQLWTARHSATTGESEAQAVAVSPDGGKVFVFGQSPAPNGHLVYTVIAYSS